MSNLTADLTMILNQIDCISNEPLWYSSSQTSMELRDVFSTFFPFSSMLKDGLRLICIKSYNDHNFVKIYQNLPKFGNLGKIGNLNFPVT